MNTPDSKPWGPFGMGQWKGDPNVYCRVCGWPEYHLWIDDVPPPADCPDGKTSARSCERVMDRLMMNAWVRANNCAPPQPCMEMLRAVAGLTWDEIEKLSDATKRGSHTITQLKEMYASRAVITSEEST